MEDEVKEATGPEHVRRTLSFAQSGTGAPSFEQRRDAS